MANGPGEQDPQHAPGQLIESALSYAIFSLDHQRLITTWSAGAAALFGWSAAEAVGRSGDMVFTPEDRTAGAPQTEAATALRDGHAEDVRWHLRQDGSRFWGNGAMNPLANGSGYVKIVRDWTRQHEIEQALRASEERQRRIVESATEYAIFTIDTAGIITSWNVGAQRILGFTEEESIGRDSRMIFTPEQRAAGAVENEMREALASDRTHVESEHLRAGGDRFWSSQTLMPVRDAEGELQGFLKILRDRTAEKQVEDRLRESEARFRLLAEGIPQLVWQSADDGQWISGGRQWCEYTGQSLADSSGRGWLAVVHPDDREATMRAWRAAKASDLLEVEHRLQRAGDGAYRWFATRAVPFKNAAGRSVEWFGTSTDIHEIKRLLQHQEVLLAELQHRTRNLLGVVRSLAAQTVKTSDTLDSFGEQFQSRLAALGRVQSVIARGEGGARLAEIVGIELLAHGAEADGKRVLVAGPDVLLPVSAIQILSLALHELATNALKYGALSRDTGRLSVTWTTDGNMSAPPRHVRLDWRESGVPLGEGFAPKRRGYGRQLIERALAYDLQARTELQFTPEGLWCVIDVPLGEQDRGVHPDG
ncbi:MAG: putative signal transduction histidine kinase with and domain [Devosia sp.]|nr:putative signal transduction histidine kinase with and domain [Devosia sp.]